MDDDNLTNLQEYQNGQTLKKIVMEMDLMMVMRLHEGLILMMKMIIQKWILI